MTLHDWIFFFFSDLPVVRTEDRSRVIVKCRQPHPRDEGLSTTIFRESWMGESEITRFYLGFCRVKTDCSLFFYSLSTGYHTAMFALTLMVRKCPHFYVPDDC
jgi:hypothetical protein